MGGEQSKETSKQESESQMDISSIAIKQQIFSDFGVKLPDNIIQIYMNGRIKNMKQFTKTYRTMTEKGYRFVSINQEDTNEISKWKENETDYVVKRGWKIPY